jgi:uncharacterized protein
MTGLRGEPLERDARMTIAISGSSGLIGSALAREVLGRGHTIKRLVRRATRSADEVAWDPTRGTIDAAALDGIDAVVNLAGEPVAQRWSGGAKARIRASRVSATSLLAAAIAQLDRKPRVLVSGSAIGVYGDRGDEVLDESSAPGTDFLALVCREWEAATAAASDSGVRVAHLRTGIVLARTGGALAKMLPPFRLGMGGRMGSGRQWMSWIALSDTVAAIVHVIGADSVSGPVNIAAPAPVTNADFTRTLARVLRRPAIVPVPRLALHALFGEMAEGAVLASQRVAPAVLMASGFTFQYPTLGQALRHELER